MSDRIAEILESAKAVRKSTDGNLTAYKAGAQSRKYAFEISDQEADSLFRSPCHYCGYHPPHRFNGIDRVVNKLGYVTGNVVACCAWCNRAKGRFPADGFLKWLQWVKSGAVAEYTPELPEPEIPWEPPAVSSPWVDPEPGPFSLGGLTPKEYVRRKVWKDLPIPAPAIPASPVVEVQPTTARKTKPIRVLRAHDFTSGRRKLPRKPAALSDSLNLKGAARSNQKAL